jgi:hypothetical protein
LRFLAAALLFVFTAGFLFAQEGSDAGYPVRGVVLNAVSHQPVARALVQLNGQNAMLTDNEGRFAFENIPAGTEMVTIRRPGYVSGRSSAIGMAMNSVAMHRIQVGADMPALQFSLVPEAMISGTVTLSTSDSADGIRISVFARRTVEGRSTWITAGTATTNSEGVYHVGGLAAGSYLIYSQPSLDRPGASTAQAWGYPATWYPGVTDASAAGMLNVTAGQTAEADIALTRRRFYPVMAAVRMGQPGGAGFLIFDSAGRNTGLAAHYNAQQQTARANVPVGSYILQARSAGRESVFGQAEFTVTGAAVTALSISVLPVQNVAVHIRRDVTASGENEANAAQVQTTGAGLNLQLLSTRELSGLPFAGGGLRPVPGTSDGSSFELQNVTQGSYWVATTAWSGYISSITSGGVDLAREPLTIGPDGSSAPIEITLRNDSGTITGQVNSGTTGSQSQGQTAAGEIPQMFVYAIPLFATTSQVHQGSAQASGQFTISNLPPGSYRVVACDSQQEIDFHSPEGLAVWSGKGQTVSVEAGGSAGAQLDLIHTEGQP